MVSTNYINTSQSGIHCPHKCLLKICISLGDEYTYFFFYTNSTQDIVLRGVCTVQSVVVSQGKIKQGNLPDEVLSVAVPEAKQR